MFLSLSATYVFAAFRLFIVLSTDIASAPIAGENCLIAPPVKLARLYKSEFWSCLVALPLLALPAYSIRPVALFIALLSTKLPLIEFRPLPTNLAVSVKGFFPLRTRSVSCAAPPIKPALPSISLEKDLASGLFLKIDRYGELYASPSELVSVSIPLAANAPSPAPSVVFVASLPTLFMTP